jgi:hypothetical protein
VDVLKFGSSGISVSRKRVQPMIFSIKFKTTFLPSFRRTPESRTAPHGFRLAPQGDFLRGALRLAGMTGLVFDSQESRKNLQFHNKYINKNNKL